MVGDRRCTLSALGSLGLGVISGALVVLGFDDPDVNAAALGRVVAASALTCGALSLVAGASLLAPAERGRPRSRRLACTARHKWAAAAGMTLGFLFIWPALLLLILPDSVSW